MKKTFTVNLSGSVFHIDEDAYEKLKDYLQMLTAHFGNNEEGREILQDIEARIAELFSLKMQDGSKDVIIKPWVDEVIARLGKPEDFMAGDEDDEKPGSKAFQPKVKRRMYRDPDHRVLGGVCSGMGAYFNVDMVVLRIIFIVLFFISYGTALLVYIVLWIAVPKALTTSQRLEMKGREATISNIEKSIKEEVKEVKESYKKFQKSETYDKGKDWMSQFGDVVYNVLRVALKIIVILVGVFLVFIGFVGFVSFLTSMFVGHTIISSLPWGHWGVDISIPEFANFFISTGSLTILMIAFAFLMIIPLLAILFAGTKMIFRYKSNNRAIFFSGLGLWLAALITAVVVFVGHINDYSKQTTVSQNRAIDCKDCQTLYLELGNDQYSHNSTHRFFDLDRMKMINENGETILLGNPRLNIEESDDGNFMVLVRKKARGGSLSAARENAEGIVYEITPRDSVIYFNPYFNLGESKRWLDQGVDIIVKIPKGKSVYLGENMGKIIYDIKNVSNTWDGDMVGKFWEMTPEGLSQK